MSETTKNSLFNSASLRASQIEALVRDLDGVQNSRRGHIKTEPEGIGLNNKATTEELDQKALDLLERYLKHPSHDHSSHTKSEKSAYSIYQIDRSLRNAVVMKDITSIRLLLNSEMADFHYRPQPGKPSTYELINKNSHDILAIHDIIDASSSRHHQHAPEFIRSAGLFRKHMQQIQEKKRWLARQSHQRSLISSLIPFSGLRILDYKSVWGMSMSSAWIMAKHDYSIHIMNRTFYALIAFAERLYQTDTWQQELFDAFQKIIMILQANNHQIQGCITYKSMQELCENPEELTRIEAKVNSIQPDFFNQNTILAYNPEQIPSTPSGNQRTPTYDDAMQPIMDLCVYGDTIQDELDQLAKIVHEACAKIDPSSPLFRQQVIQTAALLHHGIIAIHPFVDGNGRTARKLASTLCSYYGFTLANDTTLKSHPAIWHVKGIEYQAHGDDCSAYDVAVAQDFRHMKPYKDGVTNLHVSHFAQWLDQMHLVDKKLDVHNGLAAKRPT